MSNNAIRKVGGALLAGTVALSLAACGSASDGEDDTKELSIGLIRAWSDTEVAAALLEHKALELGYEVTWEDLNDPPLLYAGVAQGDVDVYASAWIDRTHKEYYERYDDGLEILGKYHEGEGNMLAVPSYSAMQSIEDIHDHWDEIGQQIVGIEPGAGLTQQMVEEVLPAYGFEEADMITSSTPAMLIELQSAMDAGEEIVVTLWSPFWATTQMDVRPLDDPLNAFGDSEGIYYVGTAGFAEERPDLAEWLEDFELTEDEFGSLENLIVNEYEDGEEDLAIAEWLEDYPHVFDES
ncbi:MAG: glycine betaine ABC transporter substrate-binding protein [Propionibacterium sp.]|nr:glycine betaine ABC transporter substrate-binding protein [Propionibacterium sp.]